MQRFFTLFIIGLLLAGAALISTTGMPAFLRVQAQENKVVNVYTSRKEALIHKLFETFEQETGIRVNYVVDQAPKLIARMKHEEANSPADLFLTADIANIEIAKQEGLLSAVDSPALRQNVPPHFHDKDNQWFGLSRRARVIVYHKERVDPATLKTYEDLSDPKFKGRVLIRSSSNEYNQSLIASMVAAHGVEYTENWAKGLVANMARTPQGGDTDQLKALAAGQGDIAVVNNYYFERLVNSENADEREITQDLVVLYPNQPSEDPVARLKGEDAVLTRGTHINISGGGVTKNAENREHAIALLEFLSSQTAQKLYAEANYEYPIKADTMLMMGLRTEKKPFIYDTLPLQQLYTHQAEAIKLADRAGWR